MQKSSRGEEINRLEEIRKRKKLSQTDVCKRVGISKKTYYNYVHTDIIPSDKLIRLAELFDCTTDYLIGVSNYTSIVITDLNDDVLAVIDNKSVIEHSDCKVVFLED